MEKNIKGKYEQHIPLTTHTRAHTHIPLEVRKRWNQSLIFHYCFQEFQLSDVSDLSAQEAPHPLLTAREAAGFWSLFAPLSLSERPTSVVQIINKERCRKKKLLGVWPTSQTEATPEMPETQETGESSTAVANPDGFQLLIDDKFQLLNVRSWLDGQDGAKKSF